MIRSATGLLRLILFIICIGAYTAAYPQDDSTASSEIRTEDIMDEPVADTPQAASVATYTERKFDQQSIKKYTEQKDFKYEQDIAPEKMGILDWLWFQFLKLLSQTFGHRAQAAVWRVILFVIAVFAIVMIVLNLLGINVRNFFARESRMVIAPEIGVENIREMNMDELIAEATAKKQWRLSVRYQYLKALRLLTDRELIRWRPGKTNMDYYYELTEDDLKNQFLKATDDFEHVWYGNGEVTEAHYRNSRLSLEGFYSQIENHRAR